MDNDKKATLKDYPDILREWDYEKNEHPNPSSLPHRSNKKFYWKCPQGHPSYLCSIEKRTIRKNSCPVCSNHKIIPGVNDFQSRHPDLMSEWVWELNREKGVSPDSISPSSGTKVWWKCKTCGNTWEAYINNRVKGSACPYCANLKVKIGFNDLLSLRPELSKEWDYEKNGDLLPENIVAYSSKKVWWKCKICGNSWFISPVSRVNNNCPFCANRKVKKGYNDFGTLCPDASKEWDYEKNANKLPSDYVKNSEVSVWWKCEKGHSWRSKLILRAKGQNCPYCANKKVLLGYNDLNSTHPELIKEWDYEKNNKISPDKVVAGSNKTAWWKCRICGHSWKAIIASRTQRGHGCPCCGAEKAKLGRLKNMASQNPLFGNYPHLEKEWDYEKNASLDISLLPASSNKFAWWICKNGHSFKTRISSRSLKNVGCPYCSHQKILTGVTDLQTVNPVLAAEWDYEKNYPLKPSEVFPHTGKHAWWLCSVCGYSWKAKIQNRSNGRGCPQCSYAGTSLTEQIIYYYTNLVFSDAINRYKYDNEFEVDIYIPSLNTCIEFDGSYYHSLSKSINREKLKDLFFKNKDCTFIRLREEPLSHTENAINISCRCSNWKEIKETILSLFCFLNVKDLPDIDIRRDLPNIVVSRNKLLKKNSVANYSPHLLKEWDYEKNHPLKPEFFTKGSSEKAWWICPKGHSYKSSIAGRCKGVGCPHCFAERRAKGLHKKNVNRNL